MIHPGTIFPLRVSIDGHLLEIIALDGYDVMQASFESFIINPGERFDFVLTADQSNNEYWIRVESMEVRFLVSTFPEGLYLTLQCLVSTKMSLILKQTCSWKLQVCLSICDLLCLKTNQS